MCRTYVASVLLTATFCVTWQPVRGQVVKLCEENGRDCVRLDPCGGCGVNKCYNLNHNCLGPHTLKSGEHCRLREVDLPAGVNIILYNLWGSWSGYENCPSKKECHGWLCPKGAEPKDYYYGPDSRTTSDNRCAVKMTLQGGYTCGNCPSGQRRSQESSLAKCIPCSTSPCPNGQYRSPCLRAADGICVGCTNKGTTDGTYYTSAGNPYNQNNCQWECPAGYVKVAGACLPCPAGFHKPLPGPQACDSCLEGRYQPLTGQTFCSDCSKGQYQLDVGQSVCESCGPGKFQPNERSKTACSDCQVGTIASGAGQAMCLECSEGTYQANTGQSFCWPCSRLITSEACQTCSAAGDVLIKPGHCFARKVYTGVEDCFVNIEDRLSSSFVPSVSSPLFVDGTDTDVFGCSYCAASWSPTQLVPVRDGVPCPSKRCVTGSSQAPYHTTCQQGICLDQVRGLGPAQKCKDCHWCADSARGCELRPHHCELNDGTCGCSIDGACFGLNDHKPDLNRPNTGSKDLCLVASYQFTSPNDPAAWCTGSWVPAPPQLSATECEGSTACFKNQRCEAGRCLSDPYSVAPPCGRSCTCTGNLQDGADPSEDGWNCGTFDMNDQKQCRGKREDQACDLVEYCVSGLLACPSDAKAIPFINNQVSVVLLNQAQGGVGYISVESALRVLGEPDVACRNSASALLDSCPYIVKYLHVNGMKIPNGIIRCGAATIVKYLHVDALKWAGCRYALDDATALRLIESEAPTAELDLGLSSASNAKCIFLDPGSRRLPPADPFSWDAGDLLLSNALSNIPDATPVRGIVSIQLDGISEPPVCSDEYIVDNSPPPTSWLEVDALRGEGGLAYLRSRNTSTFSWEIWEWRDEHSGFGEAKIVLFRCTQNAVTVVAELTMTSEQVAAKGSATVTFPTQPDGTLFSAQFIMINGIGLASASIPVEIVVDASPPLLGGLTVSDCRNNGMEDIDFQSTRIALCARWSADEISDPESGISSIQVIAEKWIGVGRWITAAGPCTAVPNASSITLSDLVCPGMGTPTTRDLEVGVKYRVCVSGVNGAGLGNQEWRCSDGVTVDSTPPVTGDVSSINPARRSTACPEEVEDVQGSDSQIAFRWSEFVDPEGSRLFYLFELGEMVAEEFQPTLQPLQMLGVTAHNSLFLNGTYNRPCVEGWGSWVETCVNCYQKEWPAITEREVWSTGFQLKNDMVVFARLWCVNEAGLASSKVTPGITVDLTAPDGSLAVVNDVVGHSSKDGDHVAYPTHLFAYANGFEDCQSVPRLVVPSHLGDTHHSCDLGIHTIQYTFGTKPGLDDIVPISPEQCYTDGPQTFSSPTVSLEGGTRYFATAIACNRAGLCTKISSDGIIADFTDPVGGRVVDGESIQSDLNFALKSAKRFCAAWSNFTDRESDIESYEVALRQCHIGGQGDFSSAFVHVGLNLSYCFSNVELEVGSEICAVLRITNRAKLTAVKQSDGFLVCGFPSVGNVFGGPNPSSALRYQADTKTLAFQWRGFRDAGAPFVHNRIQVFVSSAKTASMQAIYGPEQTFMSQSWSRNFSLLHEHSYMAEVCVFDVLGQRACANSSLVTVDVTPPLAGIVSNGPMHHLPFLPDVTRLRAVWTGFSDPESGLEFFEWGLGSTPNSTTIMEFQRVGLATESSVSDDLHLDHGDTFHIVVRATNAVGVSVTSASEAITMHTKPPIITTLEIRETGSSSQRLNHDWNSSAKLELWWEVQPDADSAIASFPVPQLWISIGSAAGLQDVLPLFKVESDPPLSLPQLLDGGRLFVGMIAEDVLGRMDYKALFLRIDATPPSQGTVSVDSEVGQSGFATTDTVLHLHWKNFYDGETGIDRYFVGMGTSAGANDLVPFVNAGTSRSFSLHGPFPPGIAHISVVALNPAGLSASASVSVVIDATPPVPGEVREVALDHPTVDIDCVEGLSAVHAAWDAFEDDESGIARYEVAVVCTEAGPNSGCGERRFHDAGLGLSWTVEVEMEEGTRYQVVVRAWNRAGQHSEAVSDGLVAGFPSHNVDRISLSWNTNNASANCSASSRTLTAEIVVAYSTRHPIPMVRVALGSCERCEDILPFRNMETFIHGNQSWSLTPYNMSCAGSQILFVGSAAHLNTCVGSTVCQKIRFNARWIISAHMPAFVVVKATSCTSRHFFAATPVPTIDATPPLQGTVYLQQEVHPYFLPHSSVSIQWTDFHDPEGAIEMYLVGMGTMHGRDDLVPFVNAGTSRSFSLHGPFPPGIAHISVVALNPAGLSASASVSVVIDATPPVPGEVREVALDHPTVDIDCVEGLSAVHAAWDAFEDDESGIARYEVAVVCTEAGPNSGCGERRFHDAGLGLSWTVEVEMEEGTRYQVVVRAWNRAGQHSEAVSDGIRMHLTEHTIEVTVQSEPLQTTEAGVFLKGKIILGGLDNDYILQSVDFGAGITEGSTALQPLTPLPQTPSSSSFPVDRIPEEIEWRFLLPVDSTLHRQPVFVAFQTLMCSGVTLTTSHLAGHVDLTPPISVDAHVTVVESVLSYGHLAISLQWEGFQDPESGIGSFSVGISSRPRPDGISNFTNFDLVQSAKLQAAYVSDRGIFVTVVAWNRAGLSASKTVPVRHFPPVPSIPYLISQRGKRLQTAATLSAQVVRVLWDAFDTISCTMKEYEYAVVCDVSSASNVAKFYSSGRGTSALVSQADVQNAFCSLSSSFHVVVRGWDQCGLASNASTSSIQFVPSVEPRIISVVDGFHATEDKEFSSNSSVIGATAIVEGCDDFKFCKVRCGLGLLPYSFSVAALSEVWVQTAPTVLDESRSLVRCSFPAATLEHGHLYFSVVAIEYGDQDLIACSDGVVMDFTEPVVGHVTVRMTDALSGTIPAFVTSESTLNVSWTEFHEPESGPLVFTVQIITSCGAGSTEHVLGSQRILSDSENSVLVRLKPEYGLSQDDTPCLCLQAVNRALMNATRCVNLQVDNSAPSPGIVSDGLQEFDAECQLSDSVITASWHGFDSHSPILYFEWTAGTCPFCTDIVEHKKVSSSTSSVQWELSQGLRVDVVLWTSVRATNAVGLSTEATSNGVRVVCSAHNCSLPDDTVCV